MWRYETMLQAWLSHLTGPHELGCECVRFDANELVKEEFGLRRSCIWKLKLEYLIQLRLWQIFKSKIFSQGVLKDFAGRGEAIWETKDISRNLRRISAGFPLYTFFFFPIPFFSVVLVYGSGCRQSVCMIWLSPTSTTGSRASRRISPVLFVMS